MLQHKDLAFLSKEQSGDRIWGGKPDRNQSHRQSISEQREGTRHIGQEAVLEEESAQDPPSRGFPRFWEDCLFHLILALEKMGFRGIKGTQGSLDDQSALEIRPGTRFLRNLPSSRRR